jgi:hypothetical protein
MHHQSQPGDHPNHVRESPFCTEIAITLNDDPAAPNGGYTRVRRTECLLRRVIGAAVQGTRRRENPSLGCVHGLLGRAPEAVQFFGVVR